MRGREDGSIGSTRREVLGLAAAALLARGVRAQVPPEPPTPPGSSGGMPSGTSELPDMPRRALGGTGRELPILGLGCAGLGRLADDDAAIAIVRRALESGARSFDVAAHEHDGRSARRLGKALKEHARDELFIAVRLRERDGERALAELDRTLELLGVDRVDCAQVEELEDLADVERALAKDGVVRALDRARDAKKLAYVGLTALADPRLVVTALERRAFDTALVPVNPIAIARRPYLRELAAAVRAKDTGLVGTNVFAGGELVGDPPRVSTIDLVRWALAQDGVAVAIVGATSVAHWDEARWAASQKAPDEAEAKSIADAALGRTQR